MTKTLLMLIFSAISLSSTAQVLSGDSSESIDTTIAPDAKPRVRKYPARLWEISGNGLKQPSYLYGTMHVSKKLAFNLGDTFYRALQSVDVVALELAIDSWLSNIGRNKETSIFKPSEYYGNGYSSYGSFYKNGIDFSGSELKDVLGELNNYDYMSNYLLYRQGYQSPNYSEKTYVDMYIHQVGKKLGKTCTGLEDFEISRRMVNRSDWRERVLTKKSGGFGRYGYGYSEDPTESAYREGDLDMIDSLDKQDNNNKIYRKWMLYERNRIMANQIESITKTKRLFSAVGCAHLPGDSGVIEMLRRKGFTLKPIYDEAGDYAFKQKLKLDATTHPVQFKKFSSHTGELEFQLPGTPVNRSAGNNEEIFYADVTNGVYYILKRMPWYGLMKGITPDKFLKQIDSALYENIPGDITAKEHLTINGNPALDVSNKTKSGETQRHLFLMLQNHIWYVKLSSTGNYAEGKEARDFFRSITLKQQKTNWNYFEPESGGYKMYWPTSVVIKPYSFDTSTNFHGHEDLEFTDEKNNYYYLNTLHVPSYGFDSDTFHMHQLAINYAFYHQGKIDKVEFKKIDGHDAMVCTIKFAKDNKFFHFMLAADADIYYNLGLYTSDKNIPEDFLNKFGFTPFKYKYKIQKRRDPLAGFTYSRPDWAGIDRYYKIIQEEKAISQKELKYPSSAYFDYRSMVRTYDDTLEGDYKSINPIALPSGEEVAINYYRMGRIAPKNFFTELRKTKVLVNNKIDMKRYHFIDDSIDLKHEKEFVKDNKVRYLFRVKNKTFLDTIYWQGEWLVSEQITGYPGNSWLNYQRSIVNEYRTYSISTRYDKTRGISDNVKQIINSVEGESANIKPIDSAAFAKIMIHWLSSNDSIQLFRVMDNQYNMYSIPAKFDDTLMSIMKKMDKNTDWGKDYSKLIENKLIGDKYLKLIGYYMDKFRKMGDTSEVQAEMLSNLGNLKNKTALDTMIYWLLEETPLAPESSYSQYTYQNIINNAYDSLKLWKDAYKRLIPLTRYHEYEDGIMNLGMRLLDSNFIDSSIFKGMSGDMALSFRDDLKRKLAKSNANGYRDYDYGNSIRRFKNADFETFEYGSGQNRLYRNFGSDYYGNREEATQDYGTTESYEEGSLAGRAGLTNKLNSLLINQGYQSGYGSSYGNSSSSNSLYDKARILIKFYKQDQDIAKRLTRVFTMKDKEEKMLYVNLFLKNGIAIPDTMYNHYLSKKDCEYGFVQLLKKNKITEKIPANYFEEKNYATSFVYYHHFTEKTDTIVYLGKKGTQIENENGNFYFWKSKPKDKKGENKDAPWNISYVWIGSKDTLNKMDCPRYFNFDVEMNKKLSVKELMNNEVLNLQFWKHFFWEPLLPVETIKGRNSSSWGSY